MSVIHIMGGLSTNDKTETKRTKRSMGTVGKNKYKNEATREQFVIEQLTWRKIQLEKKDPLFRYYAK